ncbi:MFS transporter [Lacisediminihabitans changchengi]|uniref:MFS transporter n=1 Tax=Lacisediminihabitans changchengi TaxID=2787634 RepID=A0A934SRC5_9MICO|nr:MFS transporter [Lacisediminihabitans changchengi]MBK4347570.1 MFS transporter [Lacisediminihabitans changchengi]
MTSLPGLSEPGPSEPRRTRRIHPAWIVAAVAFLALVGAAGFRAAPGVLMLPLETEFGWSRGILSLAVSINLLFFGLTAPFAAALMERFGLRRVTSIALLLIAAGSGLSIFVTESWQLLLTWGVLIGLGTGSMALVFAATVADTWFVKHRGLVVGVLTAGSATGQLAFLPLIALLVQNVGWRQASLLCAAGALVVVPLVLLFLRNRPADLGMTPYGSPALLEPGSAPDESRAQDKSTAPKTGPNAARRAIQVLAKASKVRTFWALVAGFAICGATTNGLIGTHFIPSAADHGLPETAAAGLLAVIGVFDIVGTIASGWLTDRINPRYLLVAYYGFRGVSLLILPSLLSATVRPPIVLFVVIYGLDWVATVPPTVALARELFGADGPVVFGWVFAAHQIGAAIAATTAGLVRDAYGSYTPAWLGAAGLCVIAAIVSASITRRPRAVVAGGMLGE